MRLGYVVGNVGLARALVLIGLANGVSVLFREAGIICAFPQRNVHRNAQRPLELRFIDSAHRQNSKED
jgi:hypothetical protein